jgi:predicted DNA-binding transcriptional regulator YafY
MPIGERTGDMRADRLLSILLLLQVHRKLTARNLARRLEVSERTIHRDMVALGTAGVPVTAARGAGGGWGLLESYQTNLTGLNEAEIQALFLAKPSHLLADLGLARAGEAAFIKLLAALPAIGRRDAQDVRQRIHIDPTGWRRPDENVSCIPTLQDAIWRERRLAFLYDRGEGSSPRVAEPLGLVAKGSVWYLVAAVEGQPRTYRVSRIRDARVCDDEPFARPADFDLAAYWERSSAEFVANLPRYDALVRAAPEALPRLRAGGRYMRIEREEAPERDGWVRVALRFEEEHEASEFLLPFGDQVEALDPPALRARIAGLAARVAAFYAARSGDLFSAPLSREVTS